MYPNTPPVMYLDRNWKISEAEKIDSVIARVQANDNENDPLTFGLEPLNYGFGNEEESNKTLPFRIDPNTGVVYLNESLLGRGGENFFLYVTVSDGTLTAKNEVYVNIKHQNLTNYSDVYNPHPPTFTPHANNISSLLPPFHLLPGVMGIQRQPPSQKQPLPNTNIYIPYQTNTYVQQNNDNNNNNMDIDKSELNGNKNHETNEMNDEKQIDKIASTTTVLESVKNNNNKNTSYNNHEQMIYNNNNNSVRPSVNLKEENSIKAILPIIFTICGIFVTAGIIAMFIFRKHLCAFGKSLKKKSKEEMAKKSNQSNISSNITEDSRNSMVLQHWNGPMAFSNRYVPWERENQHIQVFIYNV